MGRKQAVSTSLSTPLYAGNSIYPFLWSAQVSVVLWKERSLSCSLCLQSWADPPTCWAWCCFKTLGASGSTALGAAGTSAGSSDRLGAAVRGAERVAKLAAAGGGSCFFGGHPMLLAVGWPLWLSDCWWWWAPSERPLFLINSCFPTGAWNEDLHYGYQDRLNGNNIFVARAKLIEISQV